MLFLLFDVEVKIYRIIWLQVPFVKMIFWSYLKHPWLFQKSISNFNEQCPIPPSLLEGLSNWLLITVTIYKKSWFEVWTLCLCKVGELANSILFASMMWNLSSKYKSVSLRSMYLRRNGSFLLNLNGEGINFVGLVLSYVSILLL